MTKRQTDRQTERHRHRETDSERHRHRETDSERQRERQRDPLSDTLYGQARMYNNGKMPDA